LPLAPEVVLPVPDEYCDWPLVLRDVLLAPLVPLILLVLLPVECVPDAVGAVLDEVLPVDWA